MITVNTVWGRMAALSMLPALTLGLFASPALADVAQEELIALPPQMQQDEGVTTIITTTNYNQAAVVNMVGVSANTGDNTANGGDAGNGGDSGDNDGDAGDAGDGGEGGGGGDAKVEGGKGYAEAGDGAEGADAGKGGSTGNSGAGGAAGDGGDGGYIETGDAAASVAVSNDVNTNITDVTVEDCGCDQYNEYYEAADNYYEKSHSDESDWYQEGRRGASGGSQASDGWSVDESHWEVYTKEFVPVTTIIGTHNMNSALVMNLVGASANTGDNTANGGDAGNGGNSGDNSGDAGDGGVGGDGGDGGDAKVKGDRDGDKKSRHHRGGKDGGTAIGGDGAGAGYGEEGGDTGNSGKAGAGGDGGEAGVIVTGHADVLAAVVNVTNRNVTRITR